MPSSRFKEFCLTIVRPLPHTNQDYHHSKSQMFSYTCNEWKFCCFLPSSSDGTEMSQINAVTLSQLEQTCLHVQFIHHSTIIAAFRIDNYSEVWTNKCLSGNMSLLRLGRFPNTQFNGN